jgi:ketosteroid isomerase-like protein
VTTSANIELLRGFGNALNAHDIEAVLAYCDPNIAFHSGIGAIHGIYHGHDGVRRWHRDNREVWGEEIRAEPEAVFDLGEHTLTFYVARGRGQRSGVEVARPGAAVVRWRNGLITYIKSYRDREDALRYLGVTEDELEQIAVTDSPNVDLVRSIYADSERGDFSRVDWAQCDIEFVRKVELDPERAEGIAGMAQMWRRYLAGWAEFRTGKVDEYRELDDSRVLVTGRMSGRRKASGAEVEREFANVFEVREGRVARLTVYPDRDHALADLGLSPEAKAP